MTDTAHIQMNKGTFKVLSSDWMMVRSCGIFPSKYYQNKNVLLVMAFNVFCPVSINEVWELVSSVFGICIKKYQDCCYENNGE